MTFTDRNAEEIVKAITTPTGDTRAWCREAKALEDGTVVGLVDFMFTRAVIFDFDFGYFAGARYCYEDRKLADKAYSLIKTAKDKPLKGYTAIK